MLKTPIDNGGRIGAGHVAKIVKPGRLASVNNGFGADPADRNQMFEPFFTAARERRTELGLPTARSLLATFGSGIAFAGGGPGATFAAELGSV